MVKRRFFWESPPMDKNFVQLIGFLASFLTTFSFLPQVLQVWRTKATRDISLTMYSMFVAGIVGWLSYGLLTHDLPITIANAVTLVLAGSVLALKIKNG
jgi:MtN3 and saliva related transmembrane protein